MKKGLILTSPQSDDVTEYLYVFSKPIIEECKKRGIKFKQLKKDEVTKKNFEQNLKSYNYKMIVLNGHGEIDYVTGYKNQIILKKGDNDQLLCDRITYARSCWAASELGISCMKKNKEGCFIGYDIPFMFLIDTTWETNPSKDNIAKIFFETSNIVPLGIIKGHTSKQSNENSKKAMLKAIRKCLIKPEKDSQSIAEILWNNYSGQQLIGNPNARL